MVVSRKIRNSGLKKKKKSLRKSVLKLLRETIYSGYLPPGLKLVESELAKKFKVSRTPVREALFQLESEGIVKILPNKGAVVTTLSIDEIEETYIIFGVLSGIAASISVELIGENDVKQMEACLEKMEAIKDDIDRREYFTLNNEFHSFFLRPCKKKLLLKLIKNYTKQVGHYWYLLLSHPRNVDLFQEDHKRILNAFKLKNPKFAREIVENHIWSFGKIVVNSLRSISSFESDLSEGLFLSSFVGPVVGHSYSGTKETRRS